MSIYNKLRNLLSLFYPARCINCGELVNDKYPFCSECLKIFKPKRRERFIEANDKKIKCISAFHYEGKIRESICDFKFRDRKSYSKFFAESISKVFIPEDRIKDFDYEECSILSHSGSTPHNVITPVLRKENGKYAFYFILRNNRTNEEYPDGIFHVHKEYFNIKELV